MRAAIYTDFSSDTKEFSAVSVQEVPVPSLGAGEVLVRVIRAAANPVDVKVLSGFLKDMWRHPLPFTPGYDFSGEVAGLGEGVRNFSIGEEVWAVNWGQGTHSAGNDHVPGGAFAEYIKIPAQQLSRKPSSVSHELAAAMALVGTTAYQALFSELKVSSGTKLLILGGGTAVGFLAAQLAKRKGANVTVTCSERSLGLARKANPDHIIDYTKTKWWETGTVYDAIFDTAGEADGFTHAKLCVRPDGGFITIVSFDAGADPKAHLPLKAYFYCLSNDAATQDELMRLIQTNELNVPIDETFPFTTEGVRALLRKQEEGKSLGKNILTVA